jgi:hypothetical protein
MVAYSPKSDPVRFRQKNRPSRSIKKESRNTAIPQQNVICIHAQIIDPGEIQDCY